MGSPLVGSSTQNGVAGVQAEGVDLGLAASAQSGSAVTGVSGTGTGVHGRSNAPDGAQGQAGVVGEFDNGVGVFGRSTISSGVGGMSQTGIGVNGVSQTSVGVQGNSASSRGVAGFSDSFQGVYGHSGAQAGVVGESDQFDGVFGISHNPAHAGVSGHNPGGLAGFFDGDLEVTGDIRIAGADCAEAFEVVDRVKAEPGTVMVLDDSGGLRVSDRSYDTRVAGVVSGGGAYRPALLLDTPAAGGGVPVALVGQTYCKVDATSAPIAVGDLLTTSNTPGLAMKADDPRRAFGAVLGKALAACTGQGLIPILVTLQ
jgi:hypothetical protein